MAKENLTKAQLKILRQALISASDAGHHATVVRNAEKYLDQEPESLRALLDRCHAQVELNQYEAAAQGLEDAITLADKLSQIPDVIYGIYGNLYRAKGEFDLADQMYQKQIEFDPSDATGFLFLGSLHSARGNFKEAESVFRKGLQCEQGPIELVANGLGNVLRSQEKFTEAIEAYEKAIKIAPKLDAAKVALRDVKLAQNVS